MYEVVGVRQEQADEPVFDSMEAVAAYLKAHPATSVLVVTASTFEHMLEAGDINASTGCFYYRDSRTAVRIDSDIRDHLGAN